MKKAPEENQTQSGPGLESSDCSRVDILRIIEEEFRKAAVEFWSGKRPLSYSLDDHLRNPDVNACASESERSLCAAIGAMIKEGLL